MKTCIMFLGRTHCYAYSVWQIDLLPLQLQILDTFVKLRIWFEKYVKSKNSHNDFAEENDNIFILSDFKDHCKPQQWQVGSLFI